MSSTYYDTSYPPSVWGGDVIHPVTATAGTPGTWQPAGSQPPAGVAELQGSAITAIPSTGWVSGQYVQTMTFGAAGEATWTGTGWVGGRSPVDEPEPESSSPQEAPESPQDSPGGSQGTGTAPEPPEATEAS